MLNRVITMGTSPGKLSRDMAFTWSAHLLPRQENYTYKSHSPDFPLVQVADEVYDDAKSDRRQSPVIKYGKPAPMRQGLTNPETSFLDLSESVSSGHIGVRMDDHPVIASPFAEGEKLSIDLAANIMILLPELEEDDESKHALIVWQPSPTSVERVELRIVREGVVAGETALELLSIKPDGSGLSIQEPFSQARLLESKLHFRLTLTDTNAEMHLNGNFMGSILRDGSSEGPGYLTLFEPAHGYQMMNIARFHRLRLERTR